MTEYDEQTQAMLTELNARGVTAPMDLAVASPDVVKFWAKTTLNALPARVQILHVREADEGCSIRVWFDGKEMGGNVYQVGDFSIDDIDPGRGWDASTWYERIGEARHDRSEFGKAVFEALEASLSSSFISDDVTEMDTPCPGCGYHWDDHFTWDWPLEDEYGPDCQHEPKGAGA